MKKKTLKITACSLLIILVTLLGACSAAKRDIITTPEELLGKITGAADGDVLYVGDIDFTPAPGVARSFSRVALKKSVTIKSAYNDRRAVFINGSFDLLGSKVTGEVLSCAFDGIYFDGGTDAQSLSAEDWECCSLDGINFIDEPVKAQYAVHFGGNVQAVFSDCVFENYMYENGPVMWAYYGDYTGSPELSALLGDYSNCRLDISLKDCVIRGNAALFGGGAVYMDGCDNIVFSADNCVFSDNISGCGTFSEGGGACRFSNADTSFKDCVFSGNVANCHFEGADENAYYLSDADHTQGGAICTMNGSLAVYGGTFRNNRASIGGAVNILSTDTRFDTCTFEGNEAVPVHSGANTDIGPWTGMGMGGAVYITNDPSSPVRVYDSVFQNNSAFYAYASVYGFYTDQYSTLMPLGLGCIDLYGCTIKDNRCETSYDYSSDQIFPWASHPGNILDIEYLKLHGSVFVDETFEKDFPFSQDPDEQNEYNYAAPPSKAGAKDFSVKDIHVPGSVEKAWHADRRSPAGSNESRGALPVKVLMISVLAVLAVIAAAFYKKRKNTGTSEAVDISASSAEAEPPAEAKGTAKNTRIILNSEEIETLSKDVQLRQLLTDREMEVMCEYVSGSSRSALAEKLCISEATAKTHISNIYSKLGVRSKQELLAKLKTL